MKEVTTMDSSHSSHQEQWITIKVPKSKKKKGNHNGVNDGIVVNEGAPSWSQAAMMADDPALIAFIKQNINDPWENTKFKGYVYMGAKQKGEYGERYVSVMARRRGLDVQRAPTSTAGHDRVIGGKRTEIKFSLATRDKKNNGVKNDTFVINHVAEKKDWERIIFVGINFNAPYKCIWFTKEDFQEHLKAPDCCFKNQQGGKNSGNDDYMCSDKNLKTLFTKSFVKNGFEEW